MISAETKKTGVANCHVAVSSDSRTGNIAKTSQDSAINDASDPAMRDQPPSVDIPMKVKTGNGLIL